MQRALVPLALLAAGCGEVTDLNVVLRFDPVAGDEALACFVPSSAGSFTPEYALGTTGTLFRLANARMLMSNVELRNEAGDWVPLDNDVAFPWRRSGVTMLDFENATSTCTATGTPESNKNISGRLPIGDYVGLRFDVGVPFDTNHVSPAQGRSPVWDSDMFSNLRDGYRFVLLEVALAADPTTRWRTEVGNLGCQAESPDNAPEQCATENVATVTLDDFVLGENAVFVDFGALVANSDLSGLLAGETSGCTIDGDDSLSDCAFSQEALGLSADTGACVQDCDDQSVFGLTDFILE